MHPTHPRTLTPGSPAPPCARAWRLAVVAARRRAHRRTRPEHCPPYQATARAVPRGAAQWAGVGGPVTRWRQRFESSCSGAYAER